MKQKQKQTIPTIFTLAFKITELDQRAQRNIAVRVNESLEVITKKFSR